MSMVINKVTIKHGYCPTYTLWATLSNLRHFNMDLLKIDHGLDLLHKDILTKFFHST